MFCFLWHRPHAASAVLRAVLLPVLLAAVAAGHRPAAAQGATAQPSTRVVLPVEVMGSDGTTQAVPVYVPSALPVAALSLQMHGLTYNDKASVQVNRGPWVSLSNSTVQVAEPGKSYGGIGGSFATVKITIPLLPGLAHVGANVVSFRFNHTDNVSIGFRVLAFNFLTRQGQALLPASTFQQDNPNAWTAPRPDPISIAAGKFLWHSAPLVKSSTDHSVMRATCADCHSEDGRDLKYYSYSNYSIIQRARFHGLTPVQAAQIASYIRTLPVVSYGRPWNPPYQPGPGTDSRPPAAWAAGAGVDAVLSKDEDMLPFLFPDGITKDGIGAQDTLNMRELPVAIQLPDWNHWLPRIHPKDAFGDDFANSGFAFAYDGSGAGATQFGNLRAVLANPDKQYHQWLTNTQDAFLYHIFGTWSEQYQGYYMDQRRQNATWTAEYMDKMESVALWRLVKDWELMQEYTLEGNAPQIFPTPAGAPVAGESRSWLSESAFLASPAFVGVPENGVGHSRLEYEYRTNAWYYTQVVLNSGNRHRQGWHPVDWGYAVGRTGDLAVASGQAATLRMTAMLIKGMQQSDTNGTVEGTYGWFPHFVGDMRFFHWEKGTVQQDTFSANAAQNAATYAQIATAVTGAWFDQMQRYTPAQYAANGMSGESTVLYGGDSLFNMDKDMLPNLNTVGVDKALLGQIADWNKTVWPDFNWDSLKP